MTPTPEDSERAVGNPAYREAPGASPELAEATSAPDADDAGGKRAWSWWWLLVVILLIPVLWRMLG